MMAIVLACAGALCSGRAWGDTPPGGYTLCYVNLQGFGNNQGLIEWTTFVASIRNAAGHSLGNGAYTTQNTGGDNSPNGGLIVAQLNYEGATLTLFISPMDLYLRGIANTDGQVFFFNDFDIGSSTYTTVAQILGNNASEFTNGNANYLIGQPLNMQSNYNSMTAANNGNGRAALTFNYGTFIDAFYNLAYLNQADTENDRAHVARSLMTMIQMTSEAARFNDVLGTTRTVMSGGTQVGLPLFQQELENQWASISSYGWNVMNGANYAEVHQGINSSIGNDPYGWYNGTQYPNGWPYTLNNYSDVTRYLAMLLTNGEVNAPALGGYFQDWNHSEL